MLLIALAAFAAFSGLNFLEGVVLIDGWAAGLQGVVLLEELVWQSAAPRLRGVGREAEACLVWALWQSVVLLNDSFLFCSCQY